MQKATKALSKKREAKWYMKMLFHTKQTVLTVHRKRLCKSRSKNIATVKICLCNEKVRLCANGFYTKKKKTDTPNPKTAAIKEILHVSLKSLHVQ